MKKKREKKKKKNDRTDATPTHLKQGKTGSSVRTEVKGKMEEGTHPT